MGKNLKGKECGKGIYQRKDGLFSARYYAKNGKRKEKYFETLPEAKNWLADARYEERHNLIVTSLFKASTLYLSEQNVIIYCLYIC